MKILRAFLELGIVLALCYVFVEIVDNIRYVEIGINGRRTTRYADSEFLALPFSIIMISVLGLEWIRRNITKERPQFEKYIYLPLILLIFLSGVLIAHSMKPM